jgi:hypothetical protein
LDGSEQAECYASDIDFTALGLRPEQAEYARNRAFDRKLVLKGKFVSGTWEGFEDVAGFAAGEAWDAGTDTTPAGTYFLAHREPIVCITYPCPDTTGTKLNTTDATRMYAGVDLTPSGATPPQLDEANEHLADEGLILAAKVTNIEGPAGYAESLSASQYYVKLQRKVSNCRPTGCSGQVCSDRDVITTCEWREEYACYRNATCERQPSGACGWTPTPELEACLGGAR